MVADGWIDPGSSVTGFSSCLIKECNFPGLLWDLPCYICILTAFIDVTCAYIDL